MPARAARQEHSGIWYGIGANWRKIRDGENGGSREHKRNNLMIGFVFSCFGVRKGDDFGPN